MPTHTEDPNMIDGGLAVPRFTYESKITFGNILSIGMLVVSLVGGWFVLVGRVDASQQSIKELQSQISEITDLGQRVSTIEVRINIGQKAREDFQAETRVALKEQAQLLSQILQTQATILARLDDSKAKPLSALKSVVP
jgi:hypothetical protein